MEERAERRASGRVKLVGRLFVLWALAVAARLAYLQIYKHDELTRAARMQQEHVITLPADRGEIEDRTGKLLAISIRTDSVAVNPRLVKNPAFYASMVGGVLGLDPQELAAKIKERKESSAKGAGRGFLMVKRHISAAEKYRLLPLQRTFPVEIINDWRRYYPNGELGAHVVGSLDGESNGNAGIEQKLNLELAGKPGRALVLEGSQGDVYERLWTKQPSLPGTNLKLTINRIIQADAERFLAEGLAEAHATSGTVMVMDPQTGEILALANLPSFDPRSEKLKPEEAEARHTNIAVQIPCEPGSVMKMITVTMGLDTGNFTPESELFCYNGAFPRPGRKPIHDTHRYGNLSVAQILIKSSNIGVAQISLKCGPEQLYKYLKSFGIGDKTGIELPAESRGLLRKQACADRNDHNCWTPASHEYIAFGHEVAATAAQLARAVAVIANGGLLVQPHLVMARTQVDEGGRLVSVPVEVAAPKRVLRAETAITVRHIMELVVEEGTGTLARIPGYSSGGKTGSAQIFANGAWQHDHNSSFVGFAPATNPRIVVVVTMNHTPKLGGIASAPVFRKVAETALRVLQVPKDRPETDIAQKKPAPRADADMPENQMARKQAEPTPTRQAPVQSARLLFGPVVPDYRGKPLAAVLRESAAAGFPVETLGRGVARGQRPAPGEILPAGERIQVEFSTVQ